MAVAGKQLLLHSWTIAGFGDLLLSRTIAWTGDILLFENHSWDCLQCLQAVMPLND